MAMEEMKDMQEEVAKLIKDEAKPIKAEPISSIKPPNKLKRRHGTEYCSVDIYVAQCGKCTKWRKIPTAEEYEEIRSKILVDSFLCSKKPGVTCDEPADIEYGQGQTWFQDKAGIPKTPRGFKRSLVVRRDYSKMDAYYITPTGKRLKCHSELVAFLAANPDYKSASLSDFSFSSPKVIEDTIPECITRKIAAYAAAKAEKAEKTKDIPILPAANGNSKAIVPHAAQ